jgi:mannose-6-phosphate isomerase
LGVPQAVDLVRPLQSGAAAELEQVFGSLLRMPDAAGLVDDLVRAAARSLSDSGPLGSFARTATEVAGHFPGDPGVLAALIMNRVRLQKYEALYLPAGNLHAYLNGLGVEIMANSDNVLRGGLTSKHIDVDELLKLLDFTPGWAGPVPMVEESPGVYAYRTPAPEFALWRLAVDHEPTAGIVVPEVDLGRVLLAAEGTMTLRVRGDSQQLARGQAVFLQPGESVTVSGGGTVFVGSAGPSDGLRER